MQETQVWSLGWKYSLEKQMATLSSILYLENSMDRETGRLQLMGYRESDMIEQLTFSVMTKYFPDGTFRIWSAQNGSFSYHEGKHEADNNFIAGENLNLFYRLHPLV